MATITLAPGIYHLIPFEEGPKGYDFAPTDPEAHGREEPSEVVKIRATDYPLGISTMPGHPDYYVLSLDLNGPDPDGIATTTPFGPLTLSKRYLLCPAEAATRNDQPSDQYALNWTSLTLDTPIEVTVDGSTITVGNVRVDFDALPDVSITTYAVDGVKMDLSEITAKGITGRARTTNHVARAGDAVHTILSRGTWEFDDGVLVILAFTTNMLRDMRALDGDVARIYAGHMTYQTNHRRSHIVMRPAIGWNA